MPDDVAGSRQAPASNAVIQERIEHCVVAATMQRQPLAQHPIADGPCLFSDTLTGQVFGSPSDAAPARERPTG